MVISRDILLLMVALLLSPLMSLAMAGIALALLPLVPQAGDAAAGAVDGHAHQLVLDGGAAHLEHARGTARGGVGAADGGGVEQLVAERRDALGVLCDAR